MALSILDGNQSATTLSTILSSGQHITAHTVVSLGAQAITDIVSATSAGLTNTQLRANAVTIAGTVTLNGGTIGTVNGLQDGEGATFGLDRNFPVDVMSPLPAGTNRIGVVTIGAGTVTLGASTSQIGSVTASISNSLTISSLPAISGTVTANVWGINTLGGSRQLPVIEFGDDPAESGIPIIANISGQPAVVGDNYPLPISGTVTANGGTEIGTTGNTSGIIALGIDDVGASNALKLDGNGDLVISGTVTANSSNGSLTTRFGSVTTANTAFATSAVTNANRKYLLIQNITTASNVITVGIGFTPTTTQGIQLFAGAGLTFEGSYIPTGAVNLLSSVTASCYTILEA